MILIQRTLMLQKTSMYSKQGNDLDILLSGYHGQDDSLKDWVKGEEVEGEEGLGERLIHLDASRLPSYASPTQGPNLSEWIDGFTMQFCSYLKFL